MTELLILSSIVIILCIFIYKFLSKFGVPMLLVFITLGMIFGENGIFKINYNNFELSRDICNFAIILIIFYGGFGTNIKEAKDILKKAITLSTIGVILTALLTAFFSFYILKFDFKTSMLIGAVICSTDAASVFSILRSYNLSLKENTSSLLEVESGSNDPFSYVLTISFLTASTSSFYIPVLILKQLIIGIIIGYLLTKISKYILIKKKFNNEFTMAFILGITLFTFAISDILGGNGYISVYILGVLLGDTKFKSKKEIASFFNGLTSIMQILIFFLLGLLVNPLEALKYYKEAIILMIILTFIVRPAVVYSLLKPFKSSLKQIIIVSFAGLRGAASVVFSIVVVVSGINNGNVIFNITFLIVLLSITIQGSLLPFISKKIDMIDYNDNVLKTFNDYSDEEDVDFITFKINKNHEYINKKVSEINLIPDVLLVMIIRNNIEIIPDGNTVFKEQDRIVLCCPSFVEKNQRINLFEKKISKKSSFCNKKIFEINTPNLIAMIKRKNSVIIPKGDTTILEDDILVIINREI